jgi:hypothetical protein
MVHSTRPALVCGLLAWAALSIPVAVAIARQGPVAAMFADDQKRGAEVAQSFLSMDLPSTPGAGAPLRIYLTAGDLERAFDRPEFRPDGAIVPTNTDLMVTASSPATQRVLIDRVRKRPELMRDLEDQIAVRRKQAGSSGSGLLRIGVDTFVARLPRRTSGAKPGDRPVPGVVCLIPTEFAKGGAIDRRELFAQDRVRKGIASCLAALDAEGVQSVALPLMGAASSGIQTDDPGFEGQGVLKECRLLNAVAGIALGIHDFAPARRTLREIGIVQWDREITGMFTVPDGSRVAGSAQAAYRTYAEQIKQGLREGLAGNRTTSSDIDGSCNAILNPQ